MADFTAFGGEGLITWGRHGDYIEENWRARLPFWLRHVPGVSSSVNNPPFLQTRQTGIALQNSATCQRFLSSAFRLALTTQPLHSSYDALKTQSNSDSLNRQVRGRRQERDRDKQKDIEILIHLHICNDFYS